MGGPKSRVKSFEIDKRLVYGAWERVRSNQGSPGVDAVSVAEFADNEVFSASCVAVFEVGEHECGARDSADFGGTQGDVLQGAPAAGEQGEAAFAEAA